MLELPKFDELLKMAQNNPEELETLRQQHIDHLIDNAPEGFQQRLRGLQFQIDAQRQIHTESPLGSCMKISQMMHESFAELRGWLNKISDLNDPLRDLSHHSEERRPQKAADILAFPTS